MEFHEHRLIKLWEYELQLTFRTVNLHVSGAWRLQDDEAVAAHHDRGFRLNGPVVYSWFPVEALGKTTVGEILSGDMPSIDWRNFLFPIGSLELPSSKHFMLCHVAVGVMGTQDLSTGAWRVPEHLSSLVSMEPPVADNLKATVVVRQSDQVLPVALVEVAFDPLRIELPRFNCEMCESKPADVYCAADRAHLCSTCDASHHAISALFSKHKRVPVEQSPSQFGKCPDHPGESLDCVCMDCLDLLCAHCVLVGSHASKEFKTHKLISTVECFKAAMMRTSPVDLAAKETAAILTEKLESRHQELTDVYCNFDQLQHNLDNILRNCCASIDAIQARRVGYLQALRRQLLSQLLNGSRVTWRTLGWRCHLANFSWREIGTFSWCVRCSSTPV